MVDTLKSSAEADMKKSVEKLIEELKKVRTGRANVSMLDSVMVEYYGSPTPLNQVATLATPDARSFVITPWETNVLKDIEMALVNANLGMTPQNDGKCVRLRVPELTEERRKDLVKNIKKIVEDARVSVRMARRNANDETKRLLKDKEISEDDQKRVQDEIQKLTDKYIKDVDQISDDKEKDLMTM
ncbi:MAG: ribosome recycling factor [Bdellovibrionaceae bacterium]|nr:ribosome recycling factor [Pseudobdellovibrionaceae bacterium]|tara:strand:- start:239401 stop:239958 length:558 start_codon:yes stop_codon:yes gene_type:complete